jgi:hypothetical protein
MKKLLFILLVPITLHGQTDIYTGMSVANFVATTNANLDSIPNYGKYTWQAWNDMSCEHRLSVNLNNEDRTERFLFTHTSDIHARYDGWDRILSFITENDSINGRMKFDIVNGDLLQYSGLVPKATFLTYFDPYWERLDQYNWPIFLTIGNHDLNRDSSADTVYTITKPQQKLYVMDVMESMLSSVDFHFNPTDADGCYYYVDYDADKIRTIMLDIYDIPEVFIGSNYKYAFPNNTCLSGLQLKWLGDSALALPASDWTAIIFSHNSLADNYLNIDSSLADAVELLEGVLTQEIVSFDSTNVDNPYDLSFDFSSINGFDVILAGNIYGHTHESAYIKTNGVNYINSTSVAGGSQYETRITGSSTEDAADFYVLDSINKAVRIIRYGAGGANVGGDMTGDRGLDNSITY